MTRVRVPLGDGHTFAMQVSRRDLKRLAVGRPAERAKGDCWLESWTGKWFVVRAEPDPPTLPDSCTFYPIIVV